MTRKPIPYGRQHITEDDVNAVVETLNSDYLTQGPAIAAFEKEFASYIGCRFAVAVSNGTAALHLAAMALGVKNGDKVITTPITFAASANCIRYCHGEVDFADIDPETSLIDINQIRTLLRDSAPGTYQGIVPVDFAGRAVNLEELKKVAEEYNLWIIEDACHAPGGYFTDSKGAIQKCGNGKFADLSVFSFHPVKHIACGEGGMITTDNEALYDKLLMLRTHGITRDAEKFQNSLSMANADQQADSYPGWYMEMQDLGYNYRLTDFQAALGITQLKKADHGLKRRRAIASRYEQAFKEAGPTLIRQTGVVDGHAYHLYVIEVKDRLGLYNHLKKNQVLAQIHYFPVHLMPYYQSLGFKEGSYKMAEAYYHHCLSLPMFPTLTEEDQDYVIGKVLEYIQR